jgi:hypothetical protein
MFVLTDIWSTTTLNTNNYILSTVYEELRVFPIQNIHSVFQTKNNNFGWTLERAAK